MKIFVKRDCRYDKEVWSNEVTRVYENGVYNSVKKVEQNVRCKDKMKDFGFEKCGFIGVFEDLPRHRLR